MQWWKGVPGREDGCAKALRSERERALGLLREQRMAGLAVGWRDRKAEPGLLDAS